MALMTWTEDYRVNIAEVDEQHQKLIGMLNALHESLSGDRQVVAQKLDDLASFVVNHFSTEERLMQQYGFPGYAGHKEAHDQLVEQVVALQEKVKAGDADVTEEVTVFVKDWLQHHIPVIDKQYGPFLNERGIQ